MHMGDSHRHDKSMRIPKTARQHWVYKTFGAKQKRKGMGC